MPQPLAGPLLEEQDQPVLSNRSKPVIRGKYTGLRSLRHWLARRAVVVEGYIHLSNARIQKAAHHEMRQVTRTGSKSRATPARSPNPLGPIGAATALLAFQALFGFVAILWVSRTARAQCQRSST
jgi:hypothetical protein